MKLQPDCRRSDSAESDYVADNLVFIDKSVGLANQGVPKGPSSYK